MNLDTSKKILKIIGILTMIGASLTILLGIVAFMGIHAGVADPMIENDIGVEEGIGMMTLGGILFLALGVINLISGIVAFLAGSKATKNLAAAAMLFEALSSIGAIANLFQAGQTRSQIISGVLNILINVWAVYAAYIVRKNAVEKETEEIK